MELYCVDIECPEISYGLEITCEADSKDVAINTVSKDWGVDGKHWIVTRVRKYDAVKRTYVRV